MCALIAATHVDLEAAVAAGNFREDLLYRIKVIQLDLPPLRERTEDILPLAERFLAEIAAGKTRGGVHSHEAIDAIKSYRWPGNIRELHNVIERAIFLCQGQPIGIQHLPSEFSGFKRPPEAVGDAVSLDKLEEIHIRRVMAKTKSLDEAAKTLGIDLATLYRKRKKYGI